MQLRSFTRTQTSTTHFVVGFNWLALFFQQVTMLALPCKADIMLIIIIKYSSFKGFPPYLVGEMIHLNLVVKISLSSFDILLSLAVTSSNVPIQLIFSPIHKHKTEYWTIICKKLCNFFKMWQFYWKHFNTHAMTFFFGTENFAQMWKKRRFFFAIIKFSTNN